MVGVEAADRITMKSSKRRRIELEGALSVLRVPFEKRIDKRGEVHSEVLEDKDAARKVSGQEGTAMPRFRAWAAIYAVATQSLASPEFWSKFTAAGS
jgi:hypothetical protein